MTETTLIGLRSEVQSELINNILPFWMTRMIDNKNGGFLGRADGNGVLHEDADKGCVLNARILWTFSSAFRILKDPAYLGVAKRSMDFLLDKFFDRQNGGVFWLLDCHGQVLDGKKQIYAQAFAIYALTEYYWATGDKVALGHARDLFYMIEKFSFDKKLNGYFEAFARDWSEIDDLRLSDKDANEKKTMNTHLHVLEAYTNLYRVWPDDFLRLQLKNLILLFKNKIINNKTFNLNMFFDEEWNDKTEMISYGHNIESSWLLFEAAEVLGEDALTDEIKDVCIKIAEASREGLMVDGGMIYEKFFNKDHIDMDRHWWVQAESVLGYLNAYSLSGKKEYLDICIGSWKFISQHIVDRNNGEWYWSVDNDHVPDLKNDKAGFWKCPYHNSRMCLEIIEKTTH